MLALVVGGSIGLREFAQIRYDVHRLNTKLVTNEEANGPKRRTVMLEEEYEKLKEINLDDWRNIRGPRPWENSKEYQQQQRAAAKGLKPESEA